MKLSEKRFGTFNRIFSKRNRPRCFVIVLIFAVLSIALWDWICPGYICMRYKDTKYVLFWDDLYLVDELFPYDEVGYDMFRGCEYSDCYATIDRSLFPLDRYDAVVFHGGRYSKQENVVPKVRSPRQRYVYYNLNAPPHDGAAGFKDADGRFRNFFNWTMTYRKDSDIAVPFAKAGVDFDMQFSEPLYVNKSKFVAWMPTECKAGNLRDEFVNKLKRFFPVHVYGECGDRSCSWMPEDENNCVKVLGEYKFLLAYESVNCKDYVSRSTWKALTDYHVVPVVKGGGDYEVAVPPGSVIKIDEFKGPKDLVKYLIHLNTHPDEYMRYFKWRYFYEVNDVRLPCELCKKLQEPVGMPKYYEDVETWWRGSKDTGGPACQRG